MKEDQLAMKGQGKNEQRVSQPPAAGGESVTREDPGVGGRVSGGIPGERASSVPPGAGAGGRATSSRDSRSQKLLTGLTAAVLAVMIAGLSFGIGYILGNQNAGIRTLVRDRPAGRLPEGGLRRKLQEDGLRIPESAEEGKPPERQNRKEQIQKQLEDENTELIEGNVASTGDPPVNVH
jgi:hypothetical protein